MRSMFAKAIFISCLKRYISKLARFDASFIDIDTKRVSLSMLLSVSLSWNKLWKTWITQHENTATSFIKWVNIFSLCEMATGWFVGT